MKTDNFSNLRKAASEHRISPRPEAWDKVKSKLSNNNAKRSIVRYRNLTVAAVSVSVLCLTVLFSTYLTNRNPMIFTSNAEFKPLVIEELNDTSDPIYDVKYVHAINDVYNKKVVGIR